MSKNSALPKAFGLKRDMTAKDAKTARKFIRAKGKYFPKNEGDFWDPLAIVYAKCLAARRQTFNRELCLRFALIDEAKAYNRILSPDGEAFKSSAELFRALFPSANKSTIYSCINAGKEIYLPASRGELPDDLKVLDALEPGIAYYAVGALRDKNIRKHLPKALKDAMKPDGKLTRVSVRAAVMAAKKAAERKEGMKPNYELRKTDANALICDGAKVMGDVTLGAGVSVWYNAVIRGDDGAIVVGDGTNIQDCAVLHEKTTVGKGCTIGHGAIVHGCTVGDNTLIGMGAVVLNGARIGNDCIVGAGAVVTGKTDAPDGSMLLGSPAKVVRALKPEEIESNRASALGYLSAAQTCREAQS